MKNKRHNRRGFLGAVMLLGILLFVSCSKEEKIDVVSNEMVGFSINLSGQWGDASSRAKILNDVQTLATTGFGVFAYYTGETDWESYQTTSPEFMNNIKVYSEDDGANWTYRPSKYWLGYPGEFTSFFAYAPYKEGQTISGSQMPFTVNSDVSQQEDLLWSRSATTDLIRTDNAIPMNFFHALSRIGFTAQAKTEGTSPIQEGVQIRIKKLMLTLPTGKTGTSSTGPFYSKGTLNLNNTAETPDWTLSDTDKTNNFVLEASNFKGKTNTGFLLTSSNTDVAQILNADDSYVMIIPQDLSSEGFNVYVEYEVRLEGHASFAYTNKKAVTVKQKFEAGQAYTLNLMIGLEEVTVSSISMTKWSEVDDEVEINNIVP